MRTKARRITIKDVALTPQLSSCAKTLRRSARDRPARLSMRETRPNPPLHHPPTRNEKSRKKNYAKRTWISISAFQINGSRRNVSANLQTKAAHKGKTLRRKRSRSLQHPPSTPNYAHIQKKYTKRTWIPISPFQINRPRRNVSADLQTKQAKAGEICRPSPTQLPSNPPPHPPHRK